MNDALAPAERASIARSYWITVLPLVASLLAASAVVVYALLLSSAVSK